MTEEKLLIMQNFLKDLGLKCNLCCDGKLYLLDNKGYYQEILDKSDELGIRYVMEREPLYSPIDPYTLQQEIIGFKNFKEYFEVIE